MGVCHPATWQILQLENLPELGIPDCFLYTAFHYSKRQSVIFIQYSGTQVYFIQLHFLATGFLFVCTRNGNVPGVYYFLHRIIWPIVLWLGLSPNGIYGNGFPKNRILV